MTELRFIKIDNEIRLQYREIIQPERFGDMTIEMNWIDNVPLWDSEKQELKPNFNFKEK